MKDMKDSCHEIKETCEAKISHGKIVIPINIQVKLGTPLLHCEDHPDQGGGITPYHGEVMTPKARCAFAGLLPSICRELECAKFFPALSGGLQDKFRPKDIVSTHDNWEAWRNQPPQDGQIASANRPDARILDEVGDRWTKHDYLCGSQISLEWHYHARHKTRRFNYFCTHPDWDPSQPLTRHQFRTYAGDQFDVICYGGNPPADRTQTLGYYDPACRPFHSRVSLCPTYWDACSTQPFSTGGMIPDTPDVQTFTLPQRSGHHVILCAWEAADTGMAFHSMLDINFL